MTPDQRRMVQAAQDYDYENSPPMTSWTRVPDSQVLRLLTGALAYPAHPARPCTLVDQARWAVEYIREHYGPGSAYAREHGGRDRP